MLTWRGRRDIINGMNGDNKYDRISRAAFVAWIGFLLVVIVAGSIITAIDVIQIVHMLSRFPW